MSSKPGEEAIGNMAIACHSAGAQCCGENPDMGVKHVLERGAWSSGASTIFAMAGTGREIPGKDEVRQCRVVFPGKIAEQAAKNADVYAACFIGQRGMLISKAVNPAKQMGIAAQL